MNGELNVKNKHHQSSKGVCKMDAYEIQSEMDLKKHFENHDKTCMKIAECKRSYESVNETNCRAYHKLKEEYKKHNISYGEFGLYFNEIVMYWGQEGSVIRNIQYCPFCGIKFLLNIKESQNNGNGMINP